MSSNSSTSNLDLTQVSNEDIDQLAAKVEGFYKADSSVKTQLAWHWERNHLMLDGKQWIVYDGNRDTGGIWKQLNVSKQNEYIPRPVTNYIYDIYQTLKAYLVKNKPRSTVYPNTQTNRDKSAAKISNLILECNWERLKETQNYEYAAACVITYGTVFKKSYWDTSTLQTVKVPRMQQVPRMDPMSGQMVGMEEIQAVDPLTGEAQFDELPLGDVNTEVVEPYRIALDPLATDLHKARWIMEYSIQPLERIKELYGKNEPGYTGKVAELQPEKALSGSMGRFFQLKNSSGVRNGNTLSSDQGGADNILENSAVLKEYYEEPSVRHPNGRHVVVANGITLYAGDSPCPGDEQGDWHPYSECRWEVVPGRFWGKSPLDEAVEVQKQINSIDSVIVLTRKTMAIPQKLIPMSSGITPGSWTGRPGQEVFYRDSGTGAIPNTIPPQGVDQQVFQERAQRLEDLKQITGAIDILKGDRPPGVTAASALNLLYEVGTGKLYPVLDRWKCFVESDQKKQLKLVAYKYKEPRPKFIQQLKAKNRDLSEQMIDQFIGSDLKDNCNVIVEAGSNIPKLQAAKQAMLMEAAQAGTLNLELPANRLEFNKQLGIIGFDSDVGPDIKRAEWENDLLDDLPNSPDNMAVVLDVDVHELHIEIHSRRMKEPSFIALPVQVQQAYMQHILEHEQKIAEKMQQQQMEAATMGQPIMPEAPAGAPMPLEARGKGMTKEMKNSVLSDALPPAPLGGNK